jgi:glycosyltransferase involved in cell wall biosynthesis
MTTCLIRASHANEFELQNYRDIKDLQVVTSHHPLTQVSLPHIRLWSPTDLPNFPYRRQILNRLIGGEQWLLGLEKLVSKKSNDSNHQTFFHTAETYTPYTHQAVQLRKQGKITKLVCTCWETIPHNNEKFKRLRKWKSEAYKYVDLFHAPTERAKQALIKEGVSPAKIVVVPYGVDLSRFQLSRKERDTQRGKRPVVLTVARLVREKGMQTLEQVAAQLPQYDFQVVGSGSYTPRGSNITVSSVSYSQIHQVYQHSDLFFFPSLSTQTWEEQYGMALVEAMACGLPIVTTRSGAIPEVVGDAGELIDEQNVDKMVKSIDEILSKPDVYKQYSNRSLMHARSTYNSKVQQQLLSQLYG